MNRLRALLRSIGGGPGYQGPASDHFDGRHFFNSDAPAGRSFGDFLRWRRTAHPKSWPEWVENRARPALPTQLAPGQIALTFINHITFLIQAHGLNILTDPVYSERASPLRNRGPKRVRAPGLAFDQLPPIHLVLVSHNHYDHLDLDTLMRLEAAHAPRFITPLGNKPFLEQHGLRTVHELDWWQSLDVANTTVTVTPAQHWSSRGPGNRNRSLWCGFIVRMGTANVLFAGDTGYSKHFKEIRARHGAVDLALLPIGAYEPRWFMAPQHMNPEDAVAALQLLGARYALGYHWGTFRLTSEGIEQPKHDLGTALAASGMAPDRFLALRPGQTWIPPSTDIR